MMKTCRKYTFFWLGFVREALGFIRGAFGFVRGVLGFVRGVLGTQAHVPTCSQCPHEKHPKEDFINNKQKKMGNHWPESGGTNGGDINDGAFRSFWLVSAFLAQ